MIRSRGRRGAHRPAVTSTVLVIPVAMAMSVAMLVAMAMAITVAVAATDAPASVASGEAFYRTGLLPGGKSITAMTQADVKTTSALLSCASCHLASGLGSAEAGRAAPSLRWHRLASAGNNTRGVRPAYNDTTLIRALREGLDPAGRQLDPLMPRYVLDDAAANDLLAFLHSRSDKPSPGASPTRIELATVIAPDAIPAQREAMLAVLARFVDDHNLEVARQQALGDRDRSATRRIARTWGLSIWTLEGEPASWPRQLAAAEATKPAFVLLSGIAGSEWAPVSAFSNAGGPPSLLPNVDTPPSDVDGGRTLYFSGGLRLEARVIASTIVAAHDKSVLQIYRPGGRSEFAAQAFRSAMSRVSNLTVRESTIDALTGTAPPDPGAIVLWLDQDDLATLPAIEAGTHVYLSSTLLGGAISRTTPIQSRAPISLVHPFAVGASRSLRLRPTQAWLSARGIAPGEERIQEQTLFACRLLEETLAHLTDEQLDREYVLERVDHTVGPFAHSGTYPNASFGPGQRSLSKGAYLVPLAPPGEPLWLIPTVADGTGDSSPR